VIVSRDWKPKQEIFQALEILAEFFPRLGKVGRPLRGRRQTAQSESIPAAGWAIRLCSPQANPPYLFQALEDGTGKARRQEEVFHKIIIAGAALACVMILRPLFAGLRCSFPAFLLSSLKNLPGLGKRVVDEEIRKAGTETSGCGLYVSRTLENRCRSSSHLNTGRGFL
jgi:hypothetical protein